jgi:hypothetical protein
MTRHKQQGAEFTGNLQWAMWTELDSLIRRCGISVDRGYDMVAFEFEGGTQQNLSRVVSARFGRGTLMSAGGTCSLGARGARGCSSTKASAHEQVRASELSRASAHIADVGFDNSISCCPCTCNL